MFIYFLTVWEFEGIKEVMLHAEIEYTPKIILYFVNNRCQCLLTSYLHKYLAKKQTNSPHGILKD